MRPNAPQRADLPGGYAALDTAQVGRWLLETLGHFADHPVEAIIPVAHGAAIAGIRDGTAAFIPPDYEWDLPVAALAAYRGQRDPFPITGSPALPGGLNLGAQLHHLESAGLLAGTTLMPYPQYWAWLLSGEPVSEVSSLGCHTDLWSPEAGEFSPLARARGWDRQFAPIARAGEIIGTLRADLARATGLSPATRIHAGLHDSNAALLAVRGHPALAGHDATALSTGTWFIAMRSPLARVDAGLLPEDRDCLVNVDVAGQPLPSARFMGGREIELALRPGDGRVNLAADQPALLGAVPAVLASGAMLCPTLAPGTGPFPASRARWIGEPADPDAHRAAICLYAALVADASLDLIGSGGRLLIEGRFAGAEVFTRALAALRPHTQVLTAKAHNDVSYGALRLICPELPFDGELTRVKPLEGDLDDYRRTWRSCMEAPA